MSDFVIGINSAYHESAACLLRGGEIVAAAEEERFTRVKHAKEPSVDNADHLPELAIQYCLQQGGIELSDVRSIGYSFAPGKRLQNIALTRHSIEGDWGSAAGEAAFQRVLARVPEALASAFDTPVVDRFSWLDHHLCHAASAFFCSPFDKGAVLSVDGIGEAASTLFAYGEGTQLSPIREIRYPHSIGLLWEKLCRLLGFGPYDASKVMGLAAYGSPATYRLAMTELLTLTPNGEFLVAEETVRLRQPDFAGIESLLGPPRGPGMPIVTRHADIAAALQEATERALLHLARHLHSLTGADKLCLAGGVALNCAAIRVIADQGPYRFLFVQPAANDAGTAIGAAFLASYTTGSTAARRPMRHAFLGPGFTDSEIRDTLASSGHRFSLPVCLGDTVAKMLADGRIVGWFQGRMEFGPRALGNRSLLADPRRMDVKGRINDLIKHREDFRPFAPAILAEHVDDWYDLPRASQLAGRYMLVTAQARPGRASQIPAVVHIDGTSRLQVVDAESHPLFHDLLSRFHAITGVPLLLNTSFNDQEPIVCSPEDAMQTFDASPLDALAIGSFLVARSPYSDSFASSFP